MRNVKFSDEAWSGYLFWETQDKKTLRRLNKLIEAAARSPYDGIGRPELLTGNLAGHWSRRIDEQNRLVYQVTDSDLFVISCRYHY